MSGSDGVGYVFSARARRDLRRLDPPVQRRVVEALDRLTDDPPAGDVVRLTGVEGEWRLRVGDWRVRFTRDPETGTVQVLRVLPRGRAYRRLTNGPRLTARHRLDPRAGKPRVSRSGQRRLRYGYGFSP